MFVQYAQFIEFPPGMGLPEIRCSSLILSGL